MVSKFIMNRQASAILIAIWTILFLLNQSFDLLPLLAGQGLESIGRQYYRFLTGPLLHFNLIHLLININALYWVGYFAEERIGSIHYFAVGLIGSTLVEIIYSCIYKSSANNIGGSVWVFIYIGLVFVFQLLKPDFPKIHLGTWYGNWILGYSILGNIPLLSFIPQLSFMSYGTTVTHLCALAVGAILGLIGIYLKLF